MNLRDKVKEVLREEGKTLDQLSDQSKLFYERLEMEDEITQRPTKEQLSKLSEELRCPLAYLLGVPPFDDMALLERNKGNISIHLKFSRRIPKAQQEVLYELRYIDYLWLLDHHVERIEDGEEGFSIYYKD